MYNAVLLLEKLGNPEIPLLFIMMALGFGLWCYALINVLRSQFRNDSSKIIWAAPRWAAPRWAAPRWAAPRWALVFIFLQFLGAIIYLAVGKNQKVR